MAAEHELRDALRGLEPTAEELARHRAALAERLDERRRFGRVGRWSIAAAAAVLLAVSSLILLRAPDPSFQQETLSEVRGLVASTARPEELAVAAARAQASGSGLAPHNGRMVRVLALAPEATVGEAAEGAVLDPRPEFRAYYLEWLLDRADGATIDPEEVAVLLDREGDPLCVALLEELLDVALRTSGGRERTQTV